MFRSEMHASSELGKTATTSSSEGNLQQAPKIPFRVGISQIDEGMNRPFRVPSLGIVSAGEKPPELWSSEHYSKLGTEYLKHADDSKLDIRVSLRPDISPMTRWLLSFATEEEIRGIFDSLKGEWIDYWQDNGLLARIEDEIWRCLKDLEELPQATQVWYRDRAWRIKRIKRSVRIETLGLPTISKLNGIDV